MYDNFSKTDTLPALFSHPGLQFVSSAVPKASAPDFQARYFAAAGKNYIFVTQIIISNL